jgi:hypothetical protein
MPNEVPTVFDVVHRAVALVDPEGHDDAVAELLEVYEDDDRAAPGLGDSLAEELRSTADGLDPEGDSAAVRVAAAVAFFLSTKPRGGENDEATMRVAARLEWGEHPPEHVRAWLVDRAVEV